MQLGSSSGQVLIAIKVIDGDRSPPHSSDYSPYTLVSREVVRWCSGVIAIRRGGAIARVGKWSYSRGELLLIDWCLLAIALQEFLQRVRGGA